MSAPGLWRAGLMAAVALAAAGCSDAKPSADTAVADTTSGPVENLEPRVATPVAEPSGLGKMPLLRTAPSDGRCDSTRTSTEKRIILEGDAPLRTIMVGVSLTPDGRPFVPLYLDVKSKQARGDGREENEAIYVGFTPTGAMEMGQRRYFLTGSPPNGVDTVSTDDVASARELAQRVLQLCRGGA